MNPLDIHTPLKISNLASDETSTELPKSQERLVSNVHVYKVCILDATGTRKKIIAFSGANPIENKHELFSDIELAEVDKDNAEVLQSTQMIHKDDSIRTIKKKLINELGSELVSYDEIYLFSSIEVNMDANSVYQDLTYEGEVALSNRFISQLIANFSSSDYDFFLDSKHLNKKDEYSYSDIVRLFVKPRKLFIPIGQKMSGRRELLYSANPFDILPQTPPHYIPNKKNPLLSFENTLLLNYGELIDNTIYVLLAGDGFEYALENNIEQEYLAQLYYPFLSKQHIDRQDLFVEQHQHLIKENKRLIKPRTLKLYETVDSLYNVYYQRSSELKYVQSGITYFHIVIHPDYRSNIPIESLFKNIHAKESIPFIKYNPGSRRETIYRLYTKQTSKKGKKIPFLSKNKIFKFARQIGKSKQLSIYTESANKTEVYIDFENNGNITLLSNLDSPISQEELAALIKEVLNPIVADLNDLFASTGKKINEFNSFSDEYVEIVDLKYVSAIHLPKALDIKANLSMFTTAFIVNSDNVTKGAELQYKRVENFVKMETIDIQITDLFNSHKNEFDVLEYLKSNYQFTEKEAFEQLEKYLNEHSRIQGQFTNKAVEIAENPGFPTLFRWSAIEQKLLIEMNHITSVHYVDAFQVFIDSILRILYFPENTSVNKELFKGVVDEDVSHIKNVVAVSVIPELILAPSFIGDEGDDVDEGLIPDYEDDEEGLIPDYDEEEEPEEEEPEEEEPEETLEQPEEISEIINEQNVEKGKEEETEAEEAEEEEAEEEEEEEAEEEEEEAEEEEEEAEEEEEEGIIFYDDIVSDSDNESPTESKGGMRNDLDGQPINRKEMFYSKMKRLEPNLFLTKSQGNYAAYSRICQPTFNKQPIILTKQEKEAIDKKDDDLKKDGKLKQDESSYGKAIEYGTDPKNSHYYVCPRYWCLLTNQSITEDEVKSGKCGKVIPQKAKEIPAGHYVYEFADKREHTRPDGSYIQHYPGFKDEGTHPDNLCLPCCFNDWGSEYQKKRRSQCGVNEQGFIDETIKKKSEAQDVGMIVPDAQNVNYIIGFEKRYILIPQFRWGFLPPAIEMFLQIDHKSIVDKKNPALIKKNTSLFLRRGVQQDAKQSFIGCIADIYASEMIEQNKKGVVATPVPSIKEMRKILVKALNLDTYLKLHNGSLSRIFQPKKTHIDDADLFKYKDTDFYNTLNMENEFQRDFLQDTVASFENFVDFLSDDSSFIDHTYLWDIICCKNKELFHSGLNLVIINIVDNDITDNIEILCPTVSYSNHIYDINKPTALLIKKNEYYEPIYLYDTKGKNPTQTKLFLRNKMTKPIQRVMDIIKSSTNKYCSPNKSMPTVYHFKRNVLLDELYNNIMELDEYNIDSQVMNYQGKIIALMLSVASGESGPPIFIPCFPSAPMRNIKVEFMDGDLWNDYQTTVDYLKEIHRASQGKVLCSPKIKVVQENLIVGILTETNQFVQIVPPAENIFEDDLEIIDEVNQWAADLSFTSGKSEDAERVKTVKNVQLENQFFSAFRSFLRIALNDPNKLALRNKLIGLTDSSDKTYNSNLAYYARLSAVEVLLRKLMKNAAVFRVMDSELLYSLGEITNCVSKSSSKRYCLTEGDTDSGRLTIPKTHLVSGHDNERIYFGRIADELVRYKRIRSLLFQSKIYLNVSDVDYHVRGNEMILLDSLLTQDYFDEEPFETNAYLQNITYDISEPVISQRYGEKLTLAQQKALEGREAPAESFDAICIKETREIVGNPQTSIWRKMFPTSAKEIIFHTSHVCSFYVLVYIMKRIFASSPTQVSSASQITIENIRGTLWKAYEPFMERYSIKILDILSKQGKGELMKLVKTSKVTMETLIMSEDYYITDLDIWLLSNISRLPIVLFSQNMLKTMVTDINWLVLHGTNQSDAYYFIRSPSEMIRGRAPRYQLITPALKLNNVKGLEGMIQSGNYTKNQVSLVSFFETYQITR